MAERSGSNHDARGMNGINNNTNNYKNTTIIITTASVVGSSQT